jgi:trigger factor
MSCTVTEDGPTRRVLKISIDRASLTEKVEAGLAKVAQTSRFKGFRPGKAPLALIRKSHAAGIEEDVRRQLMGEAFSAAVKEHSLRPVGEPELNLQAMNDDPDGPLTFEFVVEIIPPFELDIPESFEIEAVLAEITDEMVDGEVHRFREQGASVEDAPEGTPVKHEDILEGTVVYEVDGVKLEPRPDRAAFTKHDLVDTVSIDGSSKAFQGATKGDTVELTATLPPHFDPGEHAGKEAKISFTIDRHRLVNLAELDEEFLGKMGVDSEQQLRERIREGLDAQRRQARDQQTDRQIEEQLLARHEMEIPARLLSKSIDHRVHEHAHQLIKKQHLESEEGHRQAEDQRSEIADATRSGLRLSFVYSRIAEEQSLTPEPEATFDQVRAMAHQQQQDPDQLLAEAQKEGWLGDVHEQLTQQNVRGWLRQRANVTETAPQPPSADGGSKGQEEKAEA